MTTVIWTWLSLSPKLELYLFAKVVRTESRCLSLGLFLVTQALQFGGLPIVLFANAPKTWIRNIAEMLGGLDCFKSYFLGLCQKLLSEESPKSFKLSVFYKIKPGLKLIWAFYLTSAREDFESILKFRNSTFHRYFLWRESKTSERDLLIKSEAVASKFSREDTSVYITPWGEEWSFGPQFFLLTKEKKGA